MHQRQITRSPSGSGSSLSPSPRIQPRIIVKDVVRSETEISSSLPESPSNESMCKESFRWLHAMSCVHKAMYDISCWGKKQELNAVQTFH